MGQCNILKQIYTRPMLHLDCQSNNSGPTIPDTGRQPKRSKWDKSKCKNK